MPVTLFDLDNTLLAGDSDYLWGCFLVKKGFVDKATYDDVNKRFFEDYKEGKLDIVTFLEFSLKPLTEISTSRLTDLHDEYMETCIRPLINISSQELIAKHRREGNHAVIITATNSFITGPIANAFGIPDLIATEPEYISGRYTGKVSGIPCYQQGKVEKLREWLQTSGRNLEDSWFYSDSHNDLPLLDIVTHPVAVDPDEKLHSIAKERNWEIISLR